VTTPATYRSVSRVRVLNERRDIWFTAPCPRDMDLAFIATLQRALKARGYYTLAVTGEMNATTTEAIRRYQADRGLDSPILSLAATRQLGLTTTVPE
jgi:peptidoglycan hydrolase-like protein with peptidoglycan-binding domain